MMSPSPEGCRGLPARRVQQGHSDRSSGVRVGSLVTVDTGLLPGTAAGRREARAPEREALPQLLVGNEAM